LPAGLLGHRDRDALAALAGAGVRLGALPTNGQTLLVAETAVGPDLDQTADVLGDLAAEVALNAVVVLDESRDRVDLVLRYVVGLLHRVDLDRRKHVIGALGPNTVDIAQGEANVLLARDIHTHHSWHVVFTSFLSPAAACGAGSCKSRARRLCGV